MILNTYFPINKASSVERMERGIDSNGVKFNFLYMLGTSNLRLHSDSTLIVHRLLDSSESSLFPMRALNVWELYIGLGGGLATYFYGMNFDYTLFLGAGPQYRSADIPIGTFKSFLKLHMQANWGYTWKAWSFGLTEKFDMNGIRLSNEDLLFSSLISRVYFSYDL